MGGCATKPKVLGGRRSRKRQPSSRSYNTNGSSSFLNDEKGSISFSHYKDQDIVATLKDEAEEIDSDTATSDHHVHHDELPSYDDDDIHDPSIKDEAEAEQIRNAITKAIEQRENDVVEEAESSGPTPTNESHDTTAGLQPENDVVQNETPAGQYDVVAQVHGAESSPPAENDVVLVEDASSLPHHASKDVGMCGPAQSNYVDEDRVIKGEDNVINANNMPSTFAL